MLRWHKLPGKRGLIADWERGSATVYKTGSEWKYEILDGGKLVISAITRTQAEAKKAAELVVVARLVTKPRRSPA